MLWLERPPILRWLAASLLVAVAAWSELSPAPTTRAVFLVEDVPSGTPLADQHVEDRIVPVGLLDTVQPDGVATSDLRAGDPLVASMVTEVMVPPDWMMIEAPVPAHASPGASATAIVLGDGSAPAEFPALVVDTGGSSDPFAEDMGTLAVPAEWVGPAAAAVADGRLAIGVESEGE